MYFGFFSSSVHAINVSFSALFEMDDEEDIEEGEEHGSEDEDTERNGTDGIIRKFTEEWGWIHSAMKVREATGLNINEVYEMNVIEFLNYLLYVRSWANVQYAMDKEAEKKAKRR